MILKKILAEEVKNKCRERGINMPIEQRKTLSFKNQFRILNEDDVLNIKKDVKISVKELATKYNVSKSTIYKIRQNKRWKNI